VFLLLRLVFLYSREFRASVRVSVRVTSGTRNILGARPGSDEQNELLRFGLLRRGMPLLKTPRKGMCTRSAGDAEQALEDAERFATESRSERLLRDDERAPEDASEETTLQSLLREIRLLREEQSRREAEDRRRDEELQQLKNQLSRSQYFSNSDATVRETEAFAGEVEGMTSRGATAVAYRDAFAGGRAASWNVGEGADEGARAVPRGAGRTTSESVCVPLRDSVAPVSAGVCVGAGIKLKPDIYDGTVPLREFFAQFELISRASHWDGPTKAVMLASCLRGKARSILESVENLGSLEYSELKSKLELRFGEEYFSQDYYSTFTSRKQKFGEDFAALGADLERLSKLAYPECPYAVRDKIACSQFISALSDYFIKRTLRLEGINSLKSAVIRARAIKEINKESFGEKGYKNFEKANLIRGETRAEEKSEKGGGRIREKEVQKKGINSTSQKECWLCGKPGHFRFECPSRKENTA